MSEEDLYRKGRYDELLERYNDLKKMFETQLWHLITGRDKSMVSGARVTYYAGMRVDPTTIGVSIGAGGIAFTISAYIFGLAPQTFGITISVIGLSFGLLSYIGKVKKPEEHV